MKASLKFLHEIATVGVMGGSVAQLVIWGVASGRALPEKALLYDMALTICKGLVLPSLVLVLLSGVLTMARHKSFHNPEWAWIKLLMTPLVLEATFVGVVGPAESAAELSQAMLAGRTVDPADLAHTLRLGTFGLWLILFVYAANVALAIWRPRVKKAAEYEAEAKAVAAAKKQEAAGEPAG
ncbi:MAG: hypothetical protein AAGD10_19225 [Myxococcota bacterium]